MNDLRANNGFFVSFDICNQNELQNKIFKIPNMEFD